MSCLSMRSLGLSSHKESMHCVSLKALNGNLYGMVMVVRNSLGLLLLITGSSEVVRQWNKNPNHRIGNLRGEWHHRTEQDAGGV